MDFELEKIKITGYKWSCPECPKEVITDSRAKTESQAKQHYYMTHS